MKMGEFETKCVGDSLFIFEKEYFLKIIETWMSILMVIFSVTNGLTKPVTPEKIEKLV